jgi:hypothetical protein
LTSVAASNVDKAARGAHAEPFFVERDWIVVLADITDYTVAKGEVSLAVYRKGLDRAARPVLFLVHGSAANTRR